MKRIKVYFWIKTAGLLSALIVVLIGANSCRERRHVTKYGPPPVGYDSDQTITKYGVPIDYEEIEFVEPDSTKLNDEPELN